MSGAFKGQVLRMATTTSTHDSGLLDVLNPVFEKHTGATVRVFSKGTGAAIRLALDNGADLIFVHSRPDEDRFVADGYGVNRRDVMYNDFVLVGPKDDPARLDGGTDAAAAFSKIRHQGETGSAKFHSRGDLSGTHLREMELWRQACVRPALLTRRDWYVQTSGGMAETLRRANAENGYTLTDRGTWLKHKDSLGNLSLRVEGALNGGDHRLLNLYGIIAVNPIYNPDVNYELAMAYIAFVTGLEGQKLIAHYRFNGEPCFIPDSRQAS
ncbi:MAG: substrate-binding domain-containing protein [bacterium]